MSKKRQRGISRRSFLGGVAASAVVTPFLSGLLSRIASAGEGTSPLRFFLMFTGNGQDPSHWVPPSGGETDFTLAPVLQPLSAHRDKLLLLRGLHGQSGHSGGMSESLTGWPDMLGHGVAENGPSIDQLLAERWSASTPLSSVELGVFPSNSANGQISYAASGFPLPAIGSPRGAFDRIFGLTNAESSAALRDQKLSVLDNVGQELQAINSKLTSEERIHLDEHLSLVRAKEEDLNRPFEPLVCDLPTTPGSGLGLEDTWKAQSDNIVGAFRCGVTRVATLRVGGWGGIESGKYDQIGISSGHHGAAHAGPADDLLAINRFHAEQFSYVLSQLDAVPEGDGTLLDCTVAIWMNELGLGGLNNHDRRDLPIVMAGGARAGLRNGAYFDLNDTDYQHYLFTLANLMGVTDLAKFGDHGTEVISQIFA